MQCLPSEQTIYTWHYKVDTLVLWCLFCHEKRHNVLILLLFTSPWKYSAHLWITSNCFKVSNAVHLYQLPTQNNIWARMKLKSHQESYYNSSSVCLFVCLFVPYILRGPLTDLRQTWWVYVGWPPICPWGVLFRKGQRVDGSTGHFHFPLYYICASLTPRSCKRPLLLCCCRV